MVTTNLFGTGCPSAATTAFAVIFGVEKRSSRDSSMCWWVMLTSTLVPTCPPMGVTVRSLGNGRQTCWATLGRVMQRLATQRANGSVNERIMANT